MLASCPFCGNPKPRLARWWSGPFTYREVRVGRRKTIQRDYGRLLGWQVRCEPCGATLRQEAASSARSDMQAAKHRLTDLWANRPPVAPPACPLCAYPEPVEGFAVDHDFPGPAGAPPPRFVRCPRCKLALIDAHMTYGEEQGWNQRRTPAAFLKHYREDIEAWKVDRDADIAEGVAKGRDLMAQVAREQIVRRARGERVVYAPLCVETERGPDGQFSVVLRQSSRVESTEK